jgi:formylglycine-generating enzyme required for sulfatase activity
MRVGASTLAILLSTLFLAAAPTGRDTLPPQAAQRMFRDCPECPDMMALPGGAFMMGAPDDEPGRYPEEGPAHPVTIRGFAIGRFDVTVGQWTAFVSATHRPVAKGCSWTARSGPKNDPDGSWQNLGFPQDETHPVVCVSWQDAEDYVAWLSERTKQKYRLPSEAEWEYAARARTTTPYFWGHTATHEAANYGAEECCSGATGGRDRWMYTSPSGAFPPNAFGLSDMSGNVLQWVADCFSPTYAGLPSNGAPYRLSVALQMSGDLKEMNGVNSCAFRMLRGGDFADPPRQIRSAFRSWGPPPGFTLRDYRSAGVGFRVARALDQGAG